MSGLEDPFGDYYDLEQPATLEEEKPPRRRNSGIIYNAISLFFVSATICVCLYFILLIRNPTLPINPFPPSSPIPTPTLFSLEAAWAELESSRPQPIPQETPASAGQETASAPVATNTPTVPPTATGAAPPPGATNTPATYPFTLQNDALTFVEHTGPEGCDYMAIAGQVFDVNGQPLPGIPVVVEGDELFSALDFTGNARQYGPSGYEIYINNRPYRGEFTVRLVSETGLPLSETIRVLTSDTCDQNVVIANFVANQPSD